MLGLDLIAASAALHRPRLNSGAEFALFSRDRYLQYTFASAIRRWRYHCFNENLSIFLLFLILRQFISGDFTSQSIILMPTNDVPASAAMGESDILRLRWLPYYRHSRRLRLRRGRCSRQHLS